MADRGVRFSVLSIFTDVRGDLVGAIGARGKRDGSTVEVNPLSARSPAPPASSLESIGVGVKARGRFPRAPMRPEEDLKGSATPAFAVDRAAATAIVGIGEVAPTAGATVNSAHTSHAAARADRDCSSRGRARAPTRPRPDDDGNEIPRSRSNRPAISNGSA